MSFHLKTYQRAALDSLTRFLAHAQAAGLPAAWGAELAFQQLPPALAAVPYRTDPFSHGWGTSERHECRTAN